MGNHFLCIGGITEKCSKIIQWWRFMSARACLCIWCHRLGTKLCDVSLLTRHRQRLGHTADSCLWDGNMHYRAHVPISARHYSLPLWFQHVFTGGGVLLWRFCACSCGGNGHVQAAVLQSWLTVWNTSAGFFSPSKFEASRKEETKALLFKL